MGAYTQADRPLIVSTPLGKDDLLLVGLSGQEAISQLFSFQLDLIAENTKEIAFDKLLGQKVTVTLALPKSKKRFFNGICNRVSQGGRDLDFTAYRMEIVPQAWLLTRKAQSRIFQHLTIPDILKKVLTGIDAAYEIQGTFQPRDYCVQYRETDFNFACRLMEEEGIYFFFKHDEGSHKMVVANTPQSHPDVPEASKIIFETISGGQREEDRITEWEKTQELRSGKYTLWDHSFELPGKNLEAAKQILDSVAAGKVTHKLKVGGNDNLELYDYPGEYAQRFDGIDKGGGDNAGDLQKIFEDNKRTVEIRMQEEAVASLLIHGAGGCRQFVAGHKFTLDRHFNADGQYLLTGVVHAVRLETSYRSGSGDGFHYHNTFTCIPFALPFRPARATPKPFIQGTQTAVVVGPAGEEIFTDKYSRIKVQFPWDRQGKKDANSSCWCRVATAWAGKQWGIIHIPRIGQEVLVGFEEGDPDRPIVVGSVYNAEQMPPYELPSLKTQAGIVTRSTLKGEAKNYNEICFEDKKGEELLYVRAEKDHMVAVENCENNWVGKDRTTFIDNDEEITVHNKRTETVEEGDESVTIKKGNRTIVVETGNDTHNVKKGNREVTVDTGNDTHKIKMGNREVTLDMGNDKHQIKMGKREVLIDMGNDELTLKMGNQTTKLSLGKSATDALQGIELTSGPSSIKIDPTGVQIKGLMVKIQGDVQTEVKGLLTAIKADVMLQTQAAITMMGECHIQGVFMSSGTLTKVAAKTAAEITKHFALGDDAKKLLKDGQTPRQFLDVLMEKAQFQDAIRFLAHALPKREAVWWACLCAKSVAGANPPPKIVAAQQAAEKWVIDPSEDNRRAAMPAAEAAEFGTPAGCAAVAAFWSGGSMAPPAAPVVPPGEFFTALGVTGSLLLAAVVSEPEKAVDKYRKFLGQGIEVANGVAKWPAAPAAAPKR